LPTALVVGSACGEMALPAIIATLFGPGPDEVAPTDPVVPPLGPVVVIYVVAAGVWLNLGLFALVHRRGTWLRGALEAEEKRRSQASS
jgi:hypothetical protein